jgi:predicted ATP-grasp superfamily ATP-dependent carboligase
VHPRFIAPKPIKMAVFVTDGHWRKTLAVVRSLGRRGVGVTVGESTGIATSFFSKYCSKRVIYPSPIRHPDRFLNSLRRELGTGYRAMFPMEEETLLLVAQHRDLFDSLVFFPVPSYEKIQFVRDKEKLLKFAMARGIPCPRTFFFKTPDEVKPDRVGIPAVIKPRIGSGAFGIRYVSDAENLLPAYLAVHQGHPLPLVQERIPQEGDSFGVSALFDENSRVRAAFVHRRLREYPITGGPSTLRESVYHPELLDLGLSLLKALDWFGVAMVEFKVDPRDNVPKLMEVNPRFWGSLQLAIFSGVDFPYLMYRMAKGERFKPVLTYEVGRRCRWLLPGDLFHFFRNPNRFHLSPPFFEFFSRNTCYDIISGEDPWPVLGRVLTLLTFLYDRDMRRFLAPR